MSLLCPACDGPIRSTDTKTGGLAMSCAACGFQGFAKSPRAATGLRGKLSGAAPAAAPAPAPKGPKKASDWLDDL